MGYCFMHIGKTKSVRQMNTEYRHNYRIDLVENANPLLADQNEELVKLNGRTYKDFFDDTIRNLKMQGIDNKVRKNATYGMQVVLTFSREETENIDIEAWKKANVEWLQKTFNPENAKTPDGKPLKTDNVASVMFHGDEEGNVHLHAYIIPINDKGKLSATYFIDGPVKMRELQNSYAEAMKPFGLERGLENSVAPHKAIKEYYTALNKIKATTLPPPLENENILTYRKRAEEVFQTAQMQWYNKVLKLERKLTETVTKHLNEKLQLKNDKKEIAKELNKVKKFLGDEDMSEVRIKEMRKSAEREETFLKALENFPDEAKATEAKRLYEELILWQQKENKKAEKRAKEEKERKEMQEQFGNNVHNPYA